MLKVYTKYLSILCMGITFNIFGAASEEAARLLETAGTRGSAAPASSMAVTNNFTQNIVVFKQLGLIADTGDIGIDMQAFPYLKRLMENGCPKRTEEEVLAMDLTREGESKAVMIFAAGDEKLRDGDYGGALRLLLTAEMQGDPFSGGILQGIFEDPSTYKAPRTCNVHMMTESKKVTSLRDLLAPCALLADAYKMRHFGFPELRTIKERLAAANAKAERSAAGVAVSVDSAAPTSVATGGAGTTGLSSSARGSLGEDATIKMPADSSSGDEAEKRLEQDNSEGASAAAPSLASGATKEGVRQRRLPTATA